LLFDWPRIDRSKPIVAVALAPGSSASNSPMSSSAPSLASGNRLVSNSRFCMRSSRMGMSVLMLASSMVMSATPASLIEPESRSKVCTSPTCSALMVTKLKDEASLSSCQLPWAEAAASSRAMKTVGREKNRGIAASFGVGRIIKNSEPTTVMQSR